MKPLSPLRGKIEENKPPHLQKDTAQYKNLHLQIAANYKKTSKFGSKVGMLEKH